MPGDPHLQPCYGFVVPFKFVPSWVIQLPDTHSLRNPSWPTLQPWPETYPLWLFLGITSTSLNGPVTFSSGHLHTLSPSGPSPESRAPVSLVLFPRGLMASVTSWSKCLLSLKMPSPRFHHTGSLITQKAEAASPPPTGTKVWFGGNTKSSTPPALCPLTSHLTFVHLHLLHSQNEENSICFTLSVYVKHKAQLSEWLVWDCWNQTAFQRPRSLSNRWEENNFSRRTEGTGTWE